MKADFQKKLSRYVYILAFASIASGLCGLMGWFLKIDALATLFNASVYIKFNTSLSLFFLGLSLVVAQLDTHIKNKIWLRSHKVLRVLSAFVPTTIGFLTFSQYLFGVDLGIDQLFWKDTLAPFVAKVIPGRMAFTTSLAIASLGTALCVLDLELGSKKYRPAQFLAVLSALISFPTIIIYLYKISFSVGIASYTQMTIYSAVSVFCVSVAILFLRPDKGFVSFLFSDSIAGLMLRDLIPSAVLIPMALGIVNLAGARRGFYDTDFALTLTVVMCVIVWMVILVHTTKGVLKMEQEALRLEVERTRLRQEREADISLFRTVLETMPSAVVVAEAPSGKIVFVNSQVEKIWGLKTVYSKEISDYVSWQGFRPDGSQYQASDWPLARSIEKGETVLSEDVHVTRSDGSHVILRLSSAPIRNQRGEITGGVVVSEDISEIKQAESLRIKLLAEQQSATAIKDSEIRLRSIFDSAFEAIITNDASGVITEWNPRAEIMFQYKREEALGKKVHELIMPESLREKHARATRRFFDTGHGPLLNKTIEIEAMRRNGELFPIQLSVSVTQKNGTLIFTSFIDDITQRKKSEKELIEARESALEAAKIKSEFLANMSHEIRTPLNAVIGLADLLSESVMSAEQKKHINLIQESGNHLLKVINDILDFSKIEAGRMTLEKNDFNLKHLLRNMADLLKHKVDEKALRFSLEIDPLIPRELRGDPGRLGQVLINLLANAIKFTKEGSVHLSVKMLNNDLTAPVLRFSVKDTGIGISEQTIKILFNPFVQADGSTNRRYGGTGLGLSICKRIVELMNGTIQVESIEGQGSEFWFTANFEAALKEHVIESKEESSTTALTALLNTNKSYKILVAEDNSTNQLLTLAQLKALGYSAQAVANGIEAIAAFNANHFDLILMDCQMPEMDGFEATRMIREIEISKGGRIPIVALTANVLKEDEQRCLAAGMDAYLSKPTKKDRLGQLLASLFAKEENRKKAA